MIKNYILDTNVLINDPDAIYKFEDNNIIIPMGVIEELDKFKKEVTDIGRNARRVARRLDELRSEGTLTEGIKVNGGKLRVVYNGDAKRYRESVDLQVIHTAQRLVEEEPDVSCVIVTRDVNIRLRADAIGLNAENYRGNVIDMDQLTKGYDTVHLDGATMQILAEQHRYDDLDCQGFLPNQYLIIKEDTDPKHSLLGRISADGQSILTLKALPHDMPIKPKNKEQVFALDALLDPDIHLVSLVGRAGTGKTLAAVAAGYYSTVIMNGKSSYSKMLISRPIMPMGRDIGFLPGDKEEKADPWMQPIYDSLDVITGKGGRSIVEKYSNLITVEVLTYIRGRSIHNQFMIVDEAQQLMPLEAKTILTRASHNTKIVLTGDIEQIDNPYVDRTSNGLITALQAFKSSPIAAHIILEQGVRSDLAEEASRLM